MNTTDGTKAMWYALRVGPQREKSVLASLVGKGYEVFLPMYRVLRVSSRHTKEVKVPLFPGYLFCRFDAHKRLSIVTTPGLLFIAGAGKVPLPVDQNEINAIQRIVSSSLHYEPCEYLREGTEIEMIAGPLTGVRGIIVSRKNSHRLLASISLLQRSVAVEIDQEWAACGSVRETIPAPGDFTSQRNHFSV
ncbi:MAG: UpxY family transcription antiterminator [Bryobacteraceae bacterium]